MDIVHTLLAKIVLTGDTVLDATAGNGGDTLVLARLVGKEGRVFAFDIQESALKETKRRLEEAGLVARVSLIHAGHENLHQVPTGDLRAAVFNLGYQPGGDMNIITRAQTTLTALETVLSRLLPGGVAILTVYWGHPGGPEEKSAVEDYAAGLPAGEWDVARLSFPNRLQAPLVIALQKRGECN